MTASLSDAQHGKTGIIHSFVRPHIQQIFNEHLLNIRLCEGLQGVHNAVLSYRNKVRMEPGLRSEIKLKHRIPPGWS